ncbi:MAG: hypothetical protein AABW68_02440 [archaeon]
MNGISKAIFLWGAICLVGYGVYHFPSFGMDVIQPLPFWSLLTVIGIAGMMAWVPSWQKNKVVWIWLGVGILGMAVHWLFLLKVIPSSLVPVLAVSPWAFWALVQGVGFVLTGKYWKSHFYYGVGILQFIVFGLLFFTNMVGLYSSALLALATGIPLMYDGLKGQK